MKENVQFIDDLRAAGAEYGAVSDLLDLIERTIVIDELGNKEVQADADDLLLFKAVFVAAAFVSHDRGE